MLMKHYFLDEIKREKEFYRLRDLPYPKDIPALGSEPEAEKPPANGVAECDFHRMDEQVLKSLKHYILSWIVVAIRTKPLTTLILFSG